MSVFRSLRGPNEPTPLHWITWYVGGCPPPTAAAVKRAALFAHALTAGSMISVGEWETQSVSGKGPFFVGGKPPTRRAGDSTQRVSGELIFAAAGRYARIAHKGGQVAKKPTVSVKYRVIRYSKCGFCF